MAILLEILAIGKSSVYTTFKILLNNYIKSFVQLIILDLAKSLIIKRKTEAS